MRILHVIPQFPYFGGRTIVGGHASCLLTLALAQHAAGHRVSILSYTQGRSGTYTIDDEISVHCLFESGVMQTARYGIKFYRAAVLWLKANFQKYDAIHFHSGYADYFFVSSKLKKITGLPTLHTLYCPIPRQGRRWRLPIVHSLISQWASQLDWLGAMTENVADSMRDYGMRDVQWVRPAVDLERFSDTGDATDLRTELVGGGDEIVVLFVGNAKRQKNLHGVLHAFHHLRKDCPHVKLIVTTELKQSSSDQDLADLGNTVKQLEIESSVVQMGIVDNMPQLMQACDLLVAPFLDSFGPSDYFMVALEAMACGKPVVVSNVGGMPEVVSDDVGRLVNPHDHIAIANGLKTFVVDDDLRRQTGVNARSHMEKHFAPRQVVDAYDTIYSEIAK